MIITCPNCNKQFKINNSLISDDGRDLQCGSCEHVWFYKAEDKSEAPLTLNENISKIVFSIINEFPFCDCTCVYIYRSAIWARSSQIC